MTLRSVAQRRDAHDGVERLWMAHAVAGRPLYWVSMYRTGGVLVDSGCAWARPVVSRFVDEGPLAAVLTTHEHEDHVGNHEAMQAEVFAPDRALRLLHEGPPRLPPYRWVTWGPHGRAPGARSVHGGQSVRAGGRSFRVLPTPGHSADHVAYLDEASGALFTGDAYLGRLKAIRAKENLRQQLDSLRRMAELDAEVLYPAHGPVVERPRARLLETVEHFERLRGKALALQERGLTPRRIRQRLLGPEPALTYVSLGGFSAENLVRALLARDDAPVTPTSNCAPHQPF